MTASYYLWKWADNDLPGQPGEVFSALLRGEMHPALQCFDAQPVLHDLQAAAEKRLSDGEDWNWQVQPSKVPRQAQFIFLRCPPIPQYGDFGRDFIDLLWQHHLSGYAEEEGRIVNELPPKLNAFELGHFHDSMRYDITEGDLPVLLGQIDPDIHCPYAILKSRTNNYVQCYFRKQGIQVEWHECKRVTGLEECIQWRAGCRNPRGNKRLPQFISERRKPTTKTARSNFVSSLMSSFGSAMY
jgi:hypothetical protein